MKYREGEATEDRWKNMKYETGGREGGRDGDKGGRGGEGGEGERREKGGREKGA